MSAKSTPRRTVVPAIPEIGQGGQDAIARALSAIKEAVEVGHGRRGDPQDRFATLRDLQDAGLARVVIDGRGGGGAVLAPPAGPGTGAPLPTGPTRPNYGDGDFTPPPKPRNVRARGLPPDINVDPDSATSEGVVMVTWDPPEYGNHFYTEVYRMPRGATPQDGTGAPVLVLASNGFNPAYAYGVDNGSGSPNVFNGGFAVLPGTADGTIFVDDGLPELPETLPGGDPVDAALNPGRYYYWVRFVSRAMVPGPLSDRAEGQLSINPARVLDAMTTRVTNTALFRNLRGWLALGSPEASSGASILEYIDNQIGEGAITSLWSLRMAQRVDGLVFTAGFGLGLETVRDANGDWRSLSTFLVNANQFAIMGANTLGGGSIITSWQTLDNQRLRFVLASAAHGFTVPDPTSTDPRQRATLMIPSGDIRTENPDDPDNPIITPIPYSQFAGIEVEVTAVNGNVVEVTSEIDLRQPRNPNTFPGFASAPSLSVPPEWQMALMPGTNIPFIVDTLRNVVGIRGSLIVDGLVRGVTGEFNNLIANTAFVRQLQAEVVNANVVIGQRIIAGTPGRGPIDAITYNGISNYIVELNNPVTNQFPLRFWKPSTGHTVFSLDNQANLFVGGHLSVAGSGVINGGGTAGTDVIFSTGGDGADTGIPGLPLGTKYALWIGQRQHYGQRGELRNEANGTFWVKSNGRAGFNADFFLGNNALALPSFTDEQGPGSPITLIPGRGRRATNLVESATSSGVRILALRNGQAAKTLVTVSGNLYKTNTVGTEKRFSIRIGMAGSPGGPIIEELGLFEWDDYSPNSAPFNMSAVCNLPAGVYYVKLEVSNYTDTSSEKMSIAEGWVAVAMQLSATGSTVPPANDAPALLPGLAMETPMDQFVNDDGAPEAAVFIPAGSFVNVYDDGGVPRVRLADASLDRRADGFVLASAELGERVAVLARGVNDRIAGLTAGTEYALSHTTPGGLVALASASTTSGHIRQVVGVALGPTALQVRIGEPVVRK